MRNPMRNVNIPKNKKKFKHNLYKPKVNDILRVVRKEIGYVDRYDEIVYIKSFQYGVPVLVIVDNDINTSGAQAFNINGANYYQKDTLGMDDDFIWKFEFIANIGKLSGMEIYNATCEIVPEFFV